MLFKSELQKAILKALDDDEVTAEVGIDVVDRNGVVTLSGEVPNVQVKRKAEAIASNHDDVMTVINEIKIDRNLKEEKTPVLVPSASEERVR